MRCLFDLKLRPIDVTVSIYFWDGAHAGAICEGFFGSLTFFGYDLEDTKAASRGCHGWICMRDYMFIGRMGEVDDLSYLFLLHEISSIAYKFVWIATAKRI